MRLPPAAPPPATPPPTVAPRRQSWSRTRTNTSKPRRRAAASAAAAAAAASATGGATADDLRAALNTAYANERFVHVTPAGKWPQTREVRGSNYCFMGVGEAGVPGQLVVISVIDNLVKGASGQALQNMNLLFGWMTTSGHTTTG